MMWQWAVEAAYWAAMPAPAAPRAESVGASLTSSCVCRTAADNALTLLWTQQATACEADPTPHVLWACTLLTEAPAGGGAADANDKPDRGESGAESGAGGVAPCDAEQLGRFADRCELLSAGGAEFWLHSAAGVCYRWDVERRCALHRVDLRSVHDCVPTAVTLHFPSHELLALMPSGELLTVGPALKTATKSPADDDGSVPSSSNSATTVTTTPRLRRVGTLASCAVDDDDDDDEGGRSSAVVSGDEAHDGSGDGGERGVGISVVVQGTLVWTVTAPRDDAPHGTLSLRHITTGALLASQALPGTVSSGNGWASAATGGGGERFPPPTAALLSRLSARRPTRMRIMRQHPPTERRT